MDNPLNSQSIPSVLQCGTYDRQLSSGIERRVFHHRQVSVGTAKGEPPDTLRLPKRCMDNLYLVWQ